jgi:hypothetical protein
MPKRPSTTALKGIRTVIVFEGARKALETLLTERALFEKIPSADGHDVVEVEGASRTREVASKAKGSEEAFRRRAPKKRSEEAFRRSVVPKKCSGEVFRRIVPKKGSRSSSTRWNRV